jgi:hypothetical protein
VKLQVADFESSEKVEATGHGTQGNCEQPDLKKWEDATGRDERCGDTALRANRGIRRLTVHFRAF